MRPVIRIFGHIKVEALVTTYKVKHRQPSVNVTFTCPDEHREIEDDRESSISLSLETLTDVFAWVHELKRYYEGR